jgi:LPXTG-motif cell wall-anchored protein
MASRLRHKFETGIAAGVVLMALVASAWLAYASSAPSGTPSYPGVTTTTKAVPPTTAKPTAPTTKPPRHTTTTVAVGGHGSSPTTDPTVGPPAGTVSPSSGDPGSLPFTGAQIAWLVLLGLLCVGLGAALVRRRQRQRA